MNDNEDRIWEGLRRHFDELGAIRPRTEATRPRERAEHQPGSGRALVSLGATAVIAVLAVVVAGQTGLLGRRAPAPGSSTPAATRDERNAGPTPGATDLLHSEAQAALERWAQAVAAAPGSSVVITGDRTGQIGDWEEAVGGNNKIAVMSGLIVAPKGLSAATPPPGEVQWSDGTSKTVPLLSATAAINQIIASAGSKCPECRAVEVTGARLGTASVQTSRGAATVPVWQFSVAGSAVKITRVAIASDVTVTPPDWDPYHPPQGNSIDSAKVSTDGRTLIVSFVGAPDHANVPCGEDYVGEAIESDLAVVVIVRTVGYTGPMPTAPPGAPSPYAVGCYLVGFGRDATVTLAAPLGDRAVLEVREGLPVPVTAQ
jgi:hypothetical protein